MRVAYIAPRFHTNQVPIIKGWTDEGDEVVFISEYAEPSEEYTYCKPYIVGYSKLFSPVKWLYNFINRKKLKTAANPKYFQVNYGFPPIIKINRILGSFKPDVVIIRDRSVYTAIVTTYCRIRQIKTILYNQTPYWEKKENTDIFHKVIRAACPKDRITPVLGKKENDSIVNPGSKYVPFVMQKRYSIEEKEHFINNKIQIICVGKFEKVKHHIELVEIVSKLTNKDEIHLTLVGECSRDSHRAYMDRLMKTIKVCDMERNVTIKTNCKQDEVYETYRKADLFVLPSAADFASVSQLEAMACSLPIICSDGNGTADCVEEGINGHCFHGLDFDELSQIIRLVTADREKLIQMGVASYRLIEEKYQFDLYKGRIMQILNEE